MLLGALSFDVNDPLRQHSPRSAIAHGPFLGELVQIFVSRALLLLLTLSLDSDSLMTALS